MVCSCHKFTTILCKELSACFLLKVRKLHSLCSAFRRGVKIVFNQPNQLRPSNIWWILSWCCLRRCPSWYTRSPKAFLCKETQWINWVRASLWAGGTRQINFRRFHQNYSHFDFSMIYYSMFLLHIDIVEQNLSWRIFPFGFGVLESSDNRKEPISMRIYFFLLNILLVRWG